MRNFERKEGETAAEYASRTALQDAGAGPNTIQALSGALIHLDDPRASELSCTDIAHGLANTCRFGGQCSEFYSVAQHAVFVRDLVLTHEECTLDRVRAALHHDDPEAFLGDVPSPLKPLLGVPWQQLEDDWDATLCELLKLPYESFRDPVVKWADEFAVYYEASRLMPSSGWNWVRDMELKLPEGVWWDEPLKPAAAKQLYLEAVNREGRMGLLP